MGSAKQLAIFAFLILVQNGFPRLASLLFEDYQDMPEKNLSLAKANLDIALLQVEADSVTSGDLYIALTEIGLTSDIALRLHQLIDVTRKFGNKVIHIGKIILLKIIEFVKAHPFLVLGAGIGAVVGAAVTALISSIPLIGPLLVPIANALGITITVAGALVGHNLDKVFKGVGEDIYEIAHSFFSLITDIFNTVYPLMTA